ncbi:methyltransferase domain-containing protein [Paraburkholderia sp. SIMBA_054]|uniref:methyltransferase domain-containing protein n=1 Tax=Paraburkholderia sp. SIMBA_054 TaxID=3085795 RepID=UPI00397E4EF2
MTYCVVCSSKAVPFRTIDKVDYFECEACGSLFADPAFLSDLEAGRVSNYQHSYWESELHAARERSYGSSLQRIAETFLYCRIPVRRFVDIGSGPGYLLDAASSALPDAADMFYGVELFPPDESLRTRHPNYKVCSIGDSGERFDAGVCVEVIEHLTPSMLNGLAKQMAQVSTPGALYLINSGQPTFVKNEDPGYLDPIGRGHVVAYSIAGAQRIFEPYGFEVIPLPGRHWAFLLEFQSEKTRQSPQELLEKRLWSPLPENVAVLRDGNAGSLMYHAGRDAARSYLEYATVIERTAWAQSLQAEVERLQALTAKQVKQIEEVRRGSKDAGANFDVQQNHPSLLGRARDWLRTHTA